MERCSASACPHWFCNKECEDGAKRNHRHQLVCGKHEDFVRLPTDNTGTNVIFPDGLTNAVRVGTSTVPILEQSTAEGIFFLFYEKATVASIGDFSPRTCRRVVAGPLSPSLLFLLTELTPRTMPCPLFVAPVEWNETSTGTTGKGIILGSLPVTQDFDAVNEWIASREIDRVAIEIVVYTVFGDPNLPMEKSIWRPL